MTPDYCPICGEPLTRQHAKDCLSPDEIKARAKAMQKPLPGLVLTDDEERVWRGVFKGPGSSEE